MVVVGAGDEAFFSEGGETAVEVAGVFLEGLGDVVEGGGAVFEEVGEHFGLAGCEGDVLEAEVLVEDGELEFVKLGGGERFYGGGEGVGAVLVDDGGSGNGGDEVLPDGFDVWREAMGIALENVMENEEGVGWGRFHTANCRANGGFFQRIWEM